MIKSIYLSTKPVSINQRYGIVRGRNILSKKYRHAKEALKWEIKQQWQADPIDENVTLNIIINYKGRKADIDAYLKILLDSLEGIVVTNDGLIDELHVFRNRVTTEHQVIVQVL